MGGRFLSAIAPVTLGILGVLIVNIPVSFTGGFVPPPLLGLMAIYYWALVRPDLMSPLWAFVIGVLEDVLSGGPPGVWAASFVAAYALIDRQRDMLAGLSGAGAIMGFAVAALAACAASYLIFAVYHWHMPSAAPVMAELAVTVVLYIPVVPLLGRVQQHVVGPLRSDF